MSLSFGTDHLHFTLGLLINTPQRQLRGRGHSLDVDLSCPCCCSDVDRRHIVKDHHNISWQVHPHGYVMSLYVETKVRQPTRKHLVSVRAIR